MTRAWLVACVIMVGCATVPPAPQPIVPDPAVEVSPHPTAAVPSGLMPQDEILRLMASDPVLDVSAKESRRAVREANTRSVIRPRRDDIKRAVVIYPVCDGCLYEILTAAQQPTDLVFSHPEEVTDVNKSDDFWDVRVKPVGDGQTRQFHVVITPKGPGLRTTMMVLTNLFVYYLQVESLPEGQVSQMMAVRWKHPVSPHPLPKLLNPGLYYTGYDIEVTSGAPDFIPEVVWDTGLEGHTLIKLPPRVSVSEMPAFYVIGTDGKLQLTNPQKRGDWLLIPRLITRGELRFGHTSDAAVVRLTRGSSYRAVWCPSSHASCPEGDL